MKPRKLIKEAQRIASPYCITNGEKFRLKDFDPGDTDGVKSKNVAESMLEGSCLMLAEMQERALQLKREGKSAEEAGRLLTAELHSKHPDYGQVERIAADVKLVYTEAQ